MIPTPPPPVHGRPGPALLLALMVVAAAVPAAPAAPVAGQATQDADVRVGSPPAIRPLEASLTLERAGALREAGRLAEALELLEARLSADPADLQARLEATRLALALGMTATDPEAGGERWLERAVAHGAQAQAMAPRSDEAVYLATAARGWTARYGGVGPRRAAELTNRVRSDVAVLLERSPGHAGAHHVAGSLEQQALELSPLARWSARVLLGVEVARDASRERALHHLERAVALDPDMLLFRYELATAYAHAGETERAVRELRTLLSLPPRLPHDAMIRDWARDRLAESTHREQTP